MIDCGISFNQMKEDLYLCDTLLLTHSHGDHIKPATLQAIRREFPRIMIFGNSHVAYQFDVDKVIGNKPFELKGGRLVIPFSGHHDVPVTCFVIQEDDINILYATDTNRLELPITPIDYFFLESNYDEGKLAKIGKQYSTRNYDAVASSKRHLSTQQARAVYFLNRRTPESPFIELHKSTRFY